MGVVADPAEEVVGDAGGASGTAGDFDGAFGVDGDIDDVCGAADDVGEFLGGVVVEAVDEAEAGAEWAR